MTFGSPVAMVLLFSLLALCCVIFALPTLFSAPPGYRKCPKCRALNPDDEKKCKKCESPIKPLPKFEDDPS